MPVVSITLLPGYSQSAKERLVARVARSVRSVIAAASAGTTVFVNGLGNVVQGGLVPLLPTTGYSFGSVTFTGVTAAANVWWRPVTPLNVELPK